jgi:solute:Na+ symporter, SSS family
VPNLALPNLAATDSLILLIYAFFMLTAGFSLKPSIKAANDFFQAGRTMPSWLCALAFAAAGLGLQAPVVLSAMGASYGFGSIFFTVLGGIPALLFLGLFMMPLYHASKARTVPEFLALRFDSKTRLLTACLFLVSAVTGAALSLLAAARVFVALHVFDEPARAAGLGATPAVLLIMALPAALVLVYLLLGGLAGSMYAQAMQLFIAIAGFFPVAVLGLKQIGWNGLKAAAASAASTYACVWDGSGQTGFASVLLALGLGLFFGVFFWCADFRVLQAAMAARSPASAQKAVLVTAAAWIVLPLLFILSGILALGMPTPHTTIVIHSENGAIVHDITVVPPAAEAGQGLVPAVMDPATDKPLRAWNGRSLLDYTQAGPDMLVHFLPMGLFGLGIAALLACLMSGVSAGVMAFGTVFTCDIYQTFLAKEMGDKRLILVGRLAVGGGMAVVFGLASVAFRFGWTLESVAITFACINAPLLAALLLGMFWKRATGHGAFAGIAAGVAVTLGPWAIILPFQGLAGGRNASVLLLDHLRYQRGLASSFGIVFAGFTVSLVVAAAVSVRTRARPDAELKGLVRSLTQAAPQNASWWKRPEILACVILLAAVVVNLIFI